MVQQAEDDLFAVERAQRGDTKIDRLAVLHLQADAAVLRQAPLGDVEAGHDLHPGDEAFVDPLRQIHHLFQQAV